MAFMLSSLSWKQHHVHSWHRYGKYYKIQVKKTPFLWFGLEPIYPHFYHVAKANNKYLSVDWWKAVKKYVKSWQKCLWVSKPIQGKMKLENVGFKMDLKGSNSSIKMLGFFLEIFGSKHKNQKNLRQRIPKKF